MLVLSVYVLGALFIETVFKLSPQVTSLLQSLDTAICFVFLWDFFHRLYLAENKLKFFFLKWGWVDLISSIPMMDSFRWGRIVRVFRILRSIRSAKFILREFADICLFRDLEKVVHRTPRNRASRTGRYSPR